MTNDYGNLELHKVLLSAMKDIDKICRENGLKYYLYAGTLLGAVNHRGFIPWDDDVDIVMFPQDFQRFCHIIQSEYNKYYEMQTFETDKNWYSKMNKLRIKGTKLTSEHGDEDSLFVDIQVLHNVPDHLWQRKIQRKKIEFINLVLSTQSGIISPTSLLSKVILGNLAKVNRIKWGRKLDRVLSQYDGMKTEYVGIMCNTLTHNPYTGRAGYDTDLTKREWHENSIQIPFEDTEFMTYSHIEEYLTYQFGSDWNKPYPEEKRVTKHGVKEYIIEPWVRERCQ